MYIIGNATQEATLFEHLVKWVTGNGSVATATPGVGNIGNGTLNNIQVGREHEYNRFDLVCTAKTARGGEFSMTRVSTRDGSSTIMPTVRVNEVYDQWDGPFKTSNRIIQLYADFGSVDFELGDTFTIDCVEVNLVDEVFFGNDKTPSVKDLSPRVLAVTEVITLTCINDGGAEAVLKWSTINFPTFDVWQKIPGYKGIVVGSLDTFTAGPDYSVDTVAGLVMIHSTGSALTGVDYDISFSATEAMATFTVEGSVSGPLLNYTQDQVADYDIASWIIPKSGNKFDPDRVFAIGDVVVFYITQNELTAVDYQWEIAGEIEHFTGDQLQFGTTGGTGLSNGDIKHIVFKAPGLSLDKQIYTSIERDWDNTGQWARWKLYGMRHYSPNFVFTEQVALTKGQWTTYPSTGWQTPIMNFWSGDLSYWIIADGQRLIVECRNNLSYKTMYMGYYLPYDFPYANPYPLAIGGSSIESKPAWNSTDIGNTNFWQHASSVSTADKTANLEIFQGVDESRRVWNEKSTADLDTTFWHYEDDNTTLFPWCHRQTRQLRKNIDGSYPLIANRINRFTGQLTGLFATCGLDGQQPENILYDEVNDRKFVVFKNNDWSGGHQYCALELS